MSGCISDRILQKRDLVGVSLTHEVELDVTFVLTTRKTVEVTRSPQLSKGMCQGTLKDQGEPLRLATLAHEANGRRGDEAQEQARCMADEACSHGPVDILAHFRNGVEELNALKTGLSVATVNGNAPVFYVHVSRPERRQGFPERSLLRTCRNRMDPSSELESTS